MRFGWKKLILWTAVSLLFGAAAGMGINQFVQYQGSRYIVSADEAPRDVDAIIVPGAYVYPDGRVSDILYDRLTIALELYKERPGTKLLLTGDHGQTDYDEVNAMRRFMEERGVPSRDIFMDHAGFSTYESMYRARDVFQAATAIIVTQRYHLMRAVYNARQLGLNAYGVTSDRNRYRKMAQFELREVAARNKDFFYVHVARPKPKYLGEAIPIRGDGRLTFDQ